MENKDYYVEYMERGLPLLYCKRVNYYRDGGTIGVEFGYMARRDNESDIIEYYLSGDILWLNYFKEEREAVSDPVVIGYVLHQVKRLVELMDFDVSRGEMFCDGLSKLLDESADHQ